MGTYVIGDIHGCFNELMALFNVIEKQDKNAKYIFVGDLLDRGPDNVKMARWAIDNIFDEKNDKYISVCGNHDALIEEWANDRKMRLFYDYQYGTEYDFQTEEEEKLLFTYTENVHKLPLYLEREVSNQKYVIAHGYVPENYKEYSPYDKRESVRSLFYWGRLALYGEESPRPQEFKIICGHNPVIHSAWIYHHPKHELCTVYVGESLINVDTGCFYSGLLSAYRLEDGVIFYSGGPGVEGHEHRGNIE